MVHAGQNRLNGVFDVAKVDRDPNAIQFPASYVHLDFPVVPMDPSAIPRIAAKAMRGGKIRLYIHFKYSRQFHLHDAGRLGTPALQPDPIHCEG